MIVLTDDETAALLALIDRAIAIDAFFLSPQTRTLQGVRQKILGAPASGVDAVEATWNRESGRCERRQPCGVFGAP